jgi:HAD superfamily hydrolase (TIGR01509 family)
VLIDTMPRHAQAWQQTLRRWGLRVSRREIYAWEGESGIVTARTLLSRRGRPPTPTDIQRLLEEKQRRFTRLARRVRLNRALVRLVVRLRQRGVPLSLVTGTSWAEVQRVIPPQIRSAFRVIITGDQVRHGKPHPEPYRTAMRRLRVPARETLVVENAPYGIRSGQASGAGWVVAIASSLPQRYLQEADEVVTTVAQLCGVIECRLGVR